MFYIGITSDLRKRLWEHQENVVDGFTKRYNVHQLIYFEIYENPETAILREKQLKKWNRMKKIFLIKQKNPTFKEIMLKDIS